MARVASFHLVRQAPAGTPAALANFARLGWERRRLRAVPGLVFGRVLGTGRGDDTAPSVDPRRRAMFAVWEDEAALDTFLVDSAMARSWGRAAECYHLRMDAGRGHGRWNGADVLAGMAAPSDPPIGPVAVLTRAAVRRRRRRAFRDASRKAAPEVRGAPGLLSVVGMGEKPWGTLATFSLWRDEAALHAFAYGAPVHAGAVRRTRAEDWYAEELFARFRPYRCAGTWDGRDPARLGSNGASMP